MSANRQDNGAASFFAILGTGLTVAGGSVFYSGWRDSYKSWFIKNTPFTPLEEVPKKVAESNGPVYIKTSGTSAADVPIVTEISKRPACIYNRKLIGVWYSIGKKDDPNSQWVQDDFKQETVWHLKSKNNRGSKLYIKSFGQDIPPLEEVHTHEEMKGNFLLSLTLGFFNIKYPYKTITKEKILAPNTTLLVLGDVYKSRSDENYHAEASAPGTLSFDYSSDIEGFLVPTNPAIITTKTEEELVRDLDKQGTSKQIWGGIFTTVGLISLISGISQL